MMQFFETSPLREPIDAASADDETVSSLDAHMLAALPRLKEAAIRGWKDYRLDPRHDRIDAMRDDLRLLVYWLAREVAGSSWVHFQEGEASRKLRVGPFGHNTCTELHHQLYGQMFDRHSVTELVSSADTDLVGFLYTILKNDKTSLYRKWRTEIRHMKDIHAGTADERDEEEREAALIEGFGHELTPERIAENLQCLERFARFLQAEQLNETLEQVALVLWLSAPLISKSHGDLSENTRNTDIELAKSLGMAKSTFDRHKKKALALVLRFRSQNGY